MSVARKECLGCHKFRSLTRFHSPEDPQTCATCLYAFPTSNEDEKVEDNAPVVNKTSMQRSRLKRKSVFESRSEGLSDREKTFTYRFQLMLSRSSDFVLCPTYITSEECTLFRSYAVRLLKLRSDEARSEITFATDHGMFVVGHGKLGLLKVF